MKLYKQFMHEIKDFSNKYWWLYLIYLSFLILIFFIQKGNLPQVMITSSCHFIADIFIMMMFTAYSQQRFGPGSRFQVVSMLLFFCIKLYTGIAHSEWHYLSTDLIYALSAYKNYQMDVRNRVIRWINPLTLLCLSLVIICRILVPFEMQTQKTIFQIFWVIIQTAGIFMFGIALSCTGKEKIRFLLSVISLFTMVLGSAVLFMTKLLYHNKDLSGLDISYTLLPITVLLFFLGRLRNYFIFPSFKRVNAQFS